MLYIYLQFGTKVGLLIFKFYSKLNKIGGVDIDIDIKFCINVPRYIFSFLQITSLPAYLRN